jgi:hypothetical protein
MSDNKEHDQIMENFGEYLKAGPNQYLSTKTVNSWIADLLIKQGQDLGEITYESKTGGNWKYFDFKCDDIKYRFELDMITWYDHNYPVYSHYKPIADVQIKIIIRDKTNDGDIKASSSKKWAIKDFTSDTVLKFVDGKLAKMVESCNKRRDSLIEKAKTKENEKNKTRNRGRSWHDTIGKLGYNDMWFHDNGLTTMQVKIDPNDDEMIARVLSAVTGEDAETIMNMFKLGQIK